MKILINYADGKYVKTQHFNTWTGKCIARFDKVIEYGPKDIDDEFAKANSSILSVGRGAGLWLWKPYIIKKTLDFFNDGDYVFYADAGSFFIKGIDKIIASMGDNDIWLCGLPFSEWQFTKKEVFEQLGKINDSYTKTNQFSGSFVLLRVGQPARDFVDKWLKLCCQIQLIQPADTEQAQGFVSHREDQSLLSLCAKDTQLIMHKDPTQYGKLPEKYIRPNCEYLPVPTNDLYDTVLVHHRTPGVNIRISIRQLLCAILPREIGLKMIRKRH